MFTTTRLFFQKAFFTFFTILSLSSVLSAMEENGEFNREEQGHHSLTVKNDDLFKSTPSSTLWGKSTHWLWDNGGKWIDYGIISASTYAGAYIGSNYDDAAGYFVAESAGVRNTSTCFTQEDIITLGKSTTPYATTLRILSGGTAQYDFPLNDVGTGCGGFLGYLVGKGISKTRQWTMNGLIRCYRPVKNWCLDGLYSVGWKIADKAKELKEE